MEVFIDANFTLRGIFETPCKMFLPSTHVTLKTLLKKIDTLLHSVTIFREEELGDDISEVWLNGKNFFSLKKRLNTPLRDGDNVKIELYMAPLGGG